jgi:hypothetical protein
MRNKPDNKIVVMMATIFAICVCTTILQTGCSVVFHIVFLTSSSVKN